MKRSPIVLSFTLLVLLSLACNALSRIGNSSTDVPALETLPAIDNIEPMETDAPPQSNSNDVQEQPPVNGGDTPMTDDAFNVTDMGDLGLLYYTKMSLEDVMQFYRDELTARGYKEREILTTVTDGVFSIVFDGDPSGQAMIIQSVDLGDGSRTVTITMGDY